MLEPKPKPNGAVCKSPNTNGYEGVEYGDLKCFEPMACDDCGATWHQSVDARRYRQHQD